MENLIKEIEKEEIKLNRILEEAKGIASLIAKSETNFLDLRPDMRRIEELRRDAEDKMKFIQGMEYALRILRHNRK